MAREVDIRSEIQPWIDELYELYELTDPRRGPESEEDKLRLAQEAINICWHVFGRLLLWAQSQIVGHEICKRHSTVEDVLERRRGKELDPDSHELELLGMAYVRNRPLYIDKDEYDKFLNSLDECEYKKLLDYAALRSSIARLLISTDANSKFWRFPLSHGLKALNAGEVFPLFHPDKFRRRGKAYSLDLWKAVAISHVYFEVGCGGKKHVALEYVPRSST
jgi:hypothetical protein